jgi:hypothetical protein
MVRIDDLVAFLEITDEPDVLLETGFRRFLF